MDDFFNLRDTNSASSSRIQRFGKKVVEHYESKAPLDYNEEIPDIQPLRRRELYLKPIHDYNLAPTQYETGTLDTYFQQPFDPPELPIIKYRQEIINVIKNNMVTIVTAPTGSGKSTQVPQYIMDDEYHKEKRHFKIVVTQPRRVAAMSLANRVLSERNLPQLANDISSQGTLVGYQIGMDKKVNIDTRLIYMTTGVLLRKLISSPDLKEYTHIILDEVHERDKDTDFLLLLIKKMLCQYNNFCVKIIVMSATVDADKFASYFRTLNPDHGILIPAPKIEVKETMFSVVVFYYDEFKESINNRSYSEDLSSSMGEPMITEKMYLAARDLINSFDDIERMDQNLSPNAEVLIRGSVLVFLPGIFEIETLQRILNGHKSNKNYNILCLHSTIPRDKQMKVFEQPSQGYRKIILSTNIAESSITVPDIKYVVDFCLTKELYADSGTGMSSLRYNWASRASLDQRKGRAGRVSRGRCYRLIEKDYYDKLNDYTTPEMQRCSVEQLILWCKILSIGDPEEMLALALDPPHLGRLRESSLLLLEVGALVLPKHHIENPLDQELTFMGYIMGAMPLDVRLARLVAFGLVFDCLTEAVIMAACLSLPAFLETPYNDKEKKLLSYVSKMKKARGTFSDPVMMLNCYNEWYNKLGEGGDQREARTYCINNFLNFNRISEVASLVQDLLSSLKRMNVPDFSRFRRKHYGGTSDYYLLSLKLALAAANYPFYYLKDKHSLDKDNCLKAFGDKSPSDTIMYTGMLLEATSDEELARKYRADLSKFFHTVFDPIKRLHLESNRLYITFENPQEATVAKSVFYALKKRQIGQSLKLSSKRDTKQPVQSSKQVTLPAEGLLDISVTHVESPTKFFCHIRHPQIRFDYDSVQAEMQTIPTVRWPGRIPEHAFGMTYFGDDGDLYRVKAVRVDPNFTLKVYYLDFGNYGIINANVFFKIPYHFLQCPFQAVECSLEGIAPYQTSLSLSQQTWDRELINNFRLLILNKHFQAKICYLLNGVLHVDIFNGENSLKEYYLCQNKFTERADDYRTEFARMTIGVGEDKIQLQTVDMNSDYNCDYNPDFKTETCNLSGPTSPYEVEYVSMTQSGTQHRTVVDPNSVNSLTVCPNPTDGVSELLTASSVALSSSGGKVSLRGTTQHLPVKGLPQLLVLLFAPKVQLHTSISKLNYTGCVAGIGYEEGGDSMWPDHDLQVIFDYRLERNDINIINQIRLAMSNILEGDEDNPDRIKYTEDVIIKKQNRIKELLKELFNRVCNRDALPVMNKTPVFEWSNSYGTVNDQTIYTNMYSGEDTDIYRPHNQLLVPYSDSFVYVESKYMKPRVKWLQQTVYETDQKTGVHRGTTLVCDLCDERFEKYSSLRNHLIGDDHILELRRLDYWRSPR